MNDLTTNLFFRRISCLIFLTACNKGSYGVDCKETCGNCRDLNLCLHINGTCLNGCDAGYQGYLCKTRIYFIQKFIYQCIDK